MKSRDVKNALANKPYFKALFDKTREPIANLDDLQGMEDGTELRVVELTGNPDDVFFMDLRTLHTPAPNASDTARLMLTTRLPRNFAV